MTLDVDDLLARLTLEEKAALTSGSSFWYTAPVERLGIPAIMVSDGPHGLRAQPGVGDHVGIGGSLPATCFPTASALASTWNPSTLRRVGEALAREARASNVSVVLGPGVNMKRSPLCGRNFEYFSEDPHLAGVLATAMVTGIQSLGVGTSLKHFAANNQETDRLRVDARVDERTLREIYLPAFEKVVTSAQPWTVMCAYNKVNGLSASANPWLLTTVLREDWGFEGVVVSDWGAVYDRVPALLAGLDLEMPPALGRSPEAVVTAVRDGGLDESVLDDRVARVLRLVSRATEAAGAGETFDLDAHHALARAAAAESVVLLTNNGSLPLDPSARVALVGELARTPRFQGAGSSQVNPTRVDSVLDAAREVLGEVAFAPGYPLEDRPTADADGAALLDEARAVVRDADVAVVVVGLPASHESEGFDRTHLDLPREQLEALRAVAEEAGSTATPVVVVLVNGSVVRVDEVLPHASALVEAWLGGQAAGSGLLDVLTGRVDPSGRLAETMPLRLEDDPSFLNFPGDSQVVTYGEGRYIGYRGYDKADRQVAFPFGFGLSYTDFELSDLVVGTTGAVEDDDLAATVAVRVTNTGQRAGATVVQCYVADPEASVDREVRTLQGFAKVTLEPGASEVVEIVLDQRAFSWWSVQLDRWVVEAGRFVVAVGQHSRDLALTAEVHVDAPRVAPPLTRDSTLHEWLADPLGRELVTAAVAGGEPGAAMDDELLPVVGTMPMSTLANFGGLSLGHDALDAVAAEWTARH
ncbi:glycoside hydrolase family 3 C-terminal domain-containing protein [Phycicoccus sonneratiae]|uniref:Glycoside hydrolase family 3 C-terminal domain-containing protein n=1 Tax=Phycicoccus sonneratiae TaxID=2807628 RepID=A0ABS2CPP9_9MICO|nr:glycoside hydrolase family 3 C-terminal domain-containing protein [Phycicoccus sonneraticus]MBM6401398.1 glycoside hydrolase family 3 C-terminal domain-containing protein [Phycicoccus sonneraticus]